MKERSVHRDMALTAYDQAAKIPPPDERALDFPPPFIAPQLPSILPRWFRAVFAMGTDQLNATPCQALPHLVGVTCLVIDQPLGTLARTPATPGGAQQ